jgi:hypothetical protein
MSFRLAQALFLYQQSGGVVEVGVHGEPPRQMFRSAGDARSRASIGANGLPADQSFSFMPTWDAVKPSDW